MKPQSKRESKWKNERDWARLYCNTKRTRTLKRIAKREMNRARRRWKFNPELAGV